MVAGEIPPRRAPARCRINHVPKGKSSCRARAATARSPTRSAYARAWVRAVSACALMARVWALSRWMPISARKCRCPGCRSS